MRLRRNHYKYAGSNRARRRHARYTTISAALCILGGLYLLILLLAPSQHLPTVLVGKPQKPAEVARQKIANQQLYIPKINVSIEYASGTASVLDHQSWWRFPERGNPVIGGNFILSAHRFRLGLLPGETQRKSPFYNLHQLEPGNHIYVDFQQTRYKYEVVKRYSVKPTQVSIEDPSKDAKLTLYSCTLKGEADGREVIEAKQVAKDLPVDTPLDN